MKKMMVTSIFFFAHIVFTRLFFRVVKSLDCVVKSLNNSRFWSCIDLILDKNFKSNNSKREVFQKQWGTRCVCETPMPPLWPFLLKLWPWFLTLTDDLELGTHEKVLSQDILMWNMKALTLINKKIWPMEKFLRQTNWRTNGLAHDPLMQEHKKESIMVNCLYYFSHNTLYHIKESKLISNLSKFVVCRYQHFQVNPLPNDKILDMFKLKALADDKIKVTKKTDICFGKGKKQCGKRRNCWLPAFSPFPTLFLKGYFLRVVKSRDCVVKS